MNWKEAKPHQLYEIAYNDTGAPLEHRISEAKEIKRRNRQKHGRTQYKLKEVYR